MGSTSPCNFLQRNSLYVCLSVWFLEWHLASALALNAVACKNNHPIPVLRSTSAICKQSCGWEWFTVANPFFYQAGLSQGGGQIVNTISTRGADYAHHSTLQMFCLLKSQMNACKPSPKTTCSNFNRWKSVTKLFCFHAISTDICLLF